MLWFICRTHKVNEYNEVVQTFLQEQTCTGLTNTSQESVDLGHKNIGECEETLSDNPATVAQGQLKGPQWRLCPTRDHYEPNFLPSKFLSQE